MLQRGSPAGVAEDSDGGDQYPESSNVQAGRKRKNHPIPLPVPVPHLIKKSRGRKVPDVDPEGASWASEGGKRTFKCEVTGCGKCFVRGEHLKRHIRSIHTYEKPHPCPYDGCDKSFSRRDNLGQHVRIHLLS
ncbi:hypothetical protein BKA70DRAFT_1123037 [Coprinopsis sp. MPI-PUGE-AT-0042]|nr:hypothetical protein BKA70DRAFT_1123037 [Coprinopsis sp. MPI-PUGE-AT-0042]